MSGSDIQKANSELERWLNREQDPTDAKWAKEATRIANKYGLKWRDSNWGGTEFYRTDSTLADANRWTVKFQDPEGYSQPRP